MDHGIVNRHPSCLHLSFISNLSLVKSGDLKIARVGLDVGSSFCSSTFFTLNFYRQDKVQVRPKSERHFTDSSDLSLALRIRGA